MTDQIIVTSLPDGSFHVKESGGATVDQSVKSVSAALALVRGFFKSVASAVAGPADAADSEMPGDAADSQQPDGSAGPDSEMGDDPASAWAQESKTRDPVSGRRM